MYSLDVWQLLFWFEYKRILMLE